MLGPRQTALERAALRRARPSSGRNSTARSSLPRPLQVAHQPRLGVEAARPRSSPRATAPGPGGNCRAAPAPPRRRSSRAATRLRCFMVRSPAATAALSRILRLTSWSEVSTPAELSIASVLMRPPLRAYSMRPRWVTPRLAPSPTTLARSFASRRSRTRVVGAVAGVGVALARRLDVSADAAEPQQIDLRLEDRLDQLGGRQALGLDAEPRRGPRARAGSI